MHSKPLPRFGCAISVASSHNQVRFSTSRSRSVRRQTQAALITVNPIDDAQDDVYAIDEDTQLVADVSLNDSYSAAALYTVNANVTNGKLVLNTDGSFTYAPNADYNGPDSFTYDMLDVNGDTETQTVSLTVN